MSMYNCGMCDQWKDNDYHPAEFIKDKSSDDDYPICDDCFAEREDTENKNDYGHHDYADTSFSSPEVQEKYNKLMTQLGSRHEENDNEPL